MGTIGIVKTLEENGWIVMLGTTEEHESIVRATPKLTGAEGIAALEALRATTYGEATPRLERVFELFEGVAGEAGLLEEE